MTFPEAVQFLLDFNGYSGDFSVLQPMPLKVRQPRDERPPFTLPPANSNNERVRAYLLGRGISPGVIDGFINAGLLYEDAQYHDCVFVGRNSAEKPAFAAKHGTCGSTFKGDAAGSNKRIAFRLPCNPALDYVYVFESPIDLMSWFSLYNQPIPNAIALCGLYDGALETYGNTAQR